jgi:hypothetical protein
MTIAEQQETKQKEQQDTKQKEQQDTKQKERQDTQQNMRKTVAPGTVGAPAAVPHPRHPAGSTVEHR